MKPGWEIKKLGDVCKLTNGYAFQSKDYCAEGHFVIRIGNVQDGHIELTNPRYIAIREEKQKKFVLSEGDILVSLTGNVGRVGEVMVEHLPAVLNQRVAKISISDKDFLRDFLLHFLKSPHFVAELTKAGRGAAQQNISTTDIERLIIPSPPLAEQQRIVAILDEAFAAIDQAKANTERNLKNAKELFDSYLRGVFENNTDGWVTRKLTEIATVKTGKYDANHANDNGAYRFYTCAFKYSMCDTKRFTGACIILPGNGVNVGEAFFYDGEFDAYQRTYVVHNIEINPRFLHYHMQLYWKALGTRLQYGSATNFIKIGNFQDYSVAFPSLLEQKNIVANLSAFSDRLNTLDETYKQKLGDLDELKKSILQKAFTGELTSA